MPFGPRSTEPSAVLFTAARTFPKHLNEHGVAADCHRDYTLLAVSLGVDGALSVLEEILAPNYESSVNGRISVRAETRESNREWFTAFPDFHRAMHELVVEPPFAAFRWTMSGTHRNTFAGLPATGRTMSFSGMSIWEFEAGRVRRAWLSFDPAVMMRQLTAPSEG